MIPFQTHAHTMLDDDVVKGLASAVVKADARLCVEVGSFIGTGSTVILGGLMAARDGLLYCVDVFNMDLLRFQGIAAPHLDQFIANITAMGLAPFVRALQGDSADIAAKFPALADVIYIDATHTEAAVRRDIEAWLPSLRPGGILCGDDYGTARDGFKVSAAVTALLPSHSSRGRFWWSEKP